MVYFCGVELFSCWERLIGEFSASGRDAGARIAPSLHPEPHSISRTSKSWFDKYCMCTVACMGALQT